MACPRGLSHIDPVHLLTNSDVPPRSPSGLVPRRCAAYPTAGAHPPAPAISGGCTLSRGTPLDRIVRRARPYPGKSRRSRLLRSKDIFFRNGHTSDGNRILIDLVLRTIRMGIDPMA